MAETVQLGGNAKERLTSFLERLEKLDEDRTFIVADMKAVFAELKSEGFDPKPMRKIIALRRKEPHKRKEEQEVLDLYAHALGLDLF